LLGEVADAGCVSVSLTGGEVALRSDWLRIAEEVKRRRMLLTVLTNGTAFSGDALRRLIELRPVKVAVSVYGSTADIHDAVTGVPGSFVRSIETLRSLKSAGIKCRISSVLMPETIDDYQGVAALAEELGCEFVFDPNVVPRDDGSTDVLRHRLDIERLKGFYVDDVIRPRSLEGRIIDAAEPPACGGAANCDSGFTMAFVDASGDVYPCIGFPPAFGNVNEATFLEIWNGPVAEAHREMMQRPLRECSDCELLPYCTTRCARLAATEDGNPCGPSSRACEFARLTIELRESIRGNGRLSPVKTTVR